MSVPIAAAVAAALRLLGGDRRALAAMDPSLDGFWSSYRAMAWLAPAVGLAILADVRLGEAVGIPQEASTVLLLVVGIANYVLGWIAFPLFLMAVGRPLGVGHVFVPWMVARNWTAIPASVPYVAVVAAWLLGLLPVAALGPLTLAALGFSLYCAWRVAVIAGDRPVGAAVAFTLVDFLLGLLVESGADRLFGL